MKLRLCCLLVFIICAVQIYSKEFLFKKGWYKTNRKGPKNILTNVEVISAKYLEDSLYLRIYGKIPILRKSSVRDLKVNILRLPFCGIKTLEEGAFQRLPSLKTLSLQDNEIEALTKGVFNNLGVSTLFLHRNKISFVDTEAFDSMPNLFRIKINSNKLSRWDSNWFRNTPSLTELLFRRNEFKEVPSRAFGNILGRCGCDNGTGTSIYLSKNKISSIHPDALEGLKEIGQLWLDRNLISEIDKKVFSSLSKIDVLLLSKNNIKTLPSDLFRNLKSDIKILDLSRNRNLECLPYDVVSVAKMTNVQGVKNSKFGCNCTNKLIEILNKIGDYREIKSGCKV